jgi:hypothetical protein
MDQEKKKQKTGYREFSHKDTLSLGTLLNLSICNFSMSLKLPFQERKEGAMFLKMKSFICFQMHHTTTARISMKKLCPKAPLAASIKRAYPVP